MAHVLIIGASKGTGLETVKAALTGGHKVRAFSRSAHFIPLTHHRLEPFAGDALNPQDIARALEGIDVVIQTLGIPLTDLFGKVSLFSAATAVLLPAMAMQGVRRLIALTGFGAGDSAPAIHPLQRLPFRLLLGRAYDDKTRQETLIKASDLDWTIVRPGVLTNVMPTGRYRILTTPAEWRNGAISRTDVAAFLARNITENAYLHQAPVIVN